MKPSIPIVTGTIAPQIKCEVCGDTVTKFMDVRGTRGVTKEYLKINLSESLVASAAADRDDVSSIDSAIAFNLHANS